MSEEEKDDKNSSDSSTEDDSPDEGEEASREEEDVKEKDVNSIPYSRFKEVNEEKKALQEKLKKYEEKPKEEKSDKGSDNDVGRIVQINQATKDLESDEIEELQLRADSRYKGDLLKAREDSNFNTWLEAKREKVKRESKTPEPSTKQTPSKKSPKDVTAEDLQNMSDDEKIEYYEAIGQGGVMSKIKKAQKSRENE